MFSIGAGLTGRKALARQLPAAPLLAPPQPRHAPLRERLSVEEPAHEQRLVTTQPLLELEAAPDLGLADADLRGVLEDPVPHLGRDPGRR